MHENPFIEFGAWKIRSLVLFAAAAIGSWACSGASSSLSSSASNDGGALTDSGSGLGGDGPSADGGLTAAQACAADAHAACMLRSTCSMTFGIEKDYPDEATCENRTAIPCEHSLAARGTAQDPAGIEACSAALPNESCSDFLDGNPVSACVPPAGTGQTGTACGASGQCASTFCAIGQYQVCGTCQPLPPLGASCQVAADCGRDVACAVAAGASSGTCVAYAALNAPCLTGTQPCAAQLGCVGDDPTTGTMGTCQAIAGTVGAACDGSRKTAANCDAQAGLACIPNAKGSAVGTCKAITLVAAGTRCGDIGAAPVTGVADCIGGGLCVKQLTDAGTPAATGVCVPPAQDGAPCDNDATKGPPCLAPAKCVPSAPGATAGMCVVPDATQCN
jgi:hypothetical protein